MIIAVEVEEEVTVIVQENEEEDQLPWMMGMTGTVW